MAEYIDRQAAITSIKNLFSDMPRLEFNGNRQRWRADNAEYLDSLEAIRNLPSADVVEVVRCTDCEWHSQEYCECKQFDILVADDEYCAFAKRMER